MASEGNSPLILFVDEYHHTGPREAVKLTPNGGTPATHKLGEPSNEQVDSPTPAELDKKTEERRERQKIKIALGEELGEADGLFIDALLYYIDALLYYIVEEKLTALTKARFTTAQTKGSNFATFLLPYMQEKEATSSSTLPQMPPKESDANFALYNALEKGDKLFLSDLLSYIYTDEKVPRFSCGASNLSIEVLRHYNVFLANSHYLSHRKPSVSSTPPVAPGAPQAPGTLVPTPSATHPAPAVQTGYPAQTTAAYPLAQVPGTTPGNPPVAHTTHVVQNGYGYPAQTPPQILGRVGVGTTGAQQAANFQPQSTQNGRPPAYYGAQGRHPATAVQSGYPAQQGHHPAPVVQIGHPGNTGIAPAPVTQHQGSGAHQPHSYSQMVRGGKG